MDDDNHSLYDLAESIASALSPLGLHMEGPPGIQGMLSDEVEEPEDEEDADLAFLTDKLKSNEAQAILHVNFSVNKLAWTDRILRPETVVDPSLVDGLDFSKNAFMKVEIEMRLESGEELSDILDDLIGGEDQ
jgi:hypothetical protein